jgi:hypothetical protein
MPGGPTVKELVLSHEPAQDGHDAQIRVSYRRDSRAQPQERTGPFAFAVSAEQRQLLQWYLETFIHFPWGPFLDRAGEAEALMTRLGADLFDAVFADRERAALYAHVADHLPDTRIVIHAGTPEGAGIPWELLHDRTRAPYGDLARLAHAFVRSQPDLVFEPPELSAGGTFNILLVICRPGGPDGDVPFQSVARPLLELFRPHRERVRLDVLRPPTLEQLGRVLADRPGFYHLLHFDGHGTFPRVGWRAGTTPGLASRTGCCSRRRGAGSAR